MKHKNYDGDPDKSMCNGALGGCSWVRRGEEVCVCPVARKGFKHALVPLVSGHGCYW